MPIRHLDRRKAKVAEERILETAEKEDARSRILARNDSHYHESPLGKYKKL